MNQNCTTANIHDVLRAASHLQMLPVVSACADYLHSQLDVDNCVDVLTLAETYALLPLQKLAYRFVGRHFSELQQLHCLSCMQLHTLLRHDYPIACPEHGILSMLLSWLLHERSSRLPQATSILSLINYHSISEEQECKLKDLPLFADIQDQCPEVETFLLNEFVKVRAKNGEPRCQPCGLVNVRGFEPAIVNVGGFKALSGVSNDLTYYHPSSKTWKYLTTIPHLEQCDYGIAVCRNQLYVVGGCFNQALQEHIHAYGFRYDSSNGDWTAIRPMLHERCRFYLAAVGDRLFAIGGIGEGDDLPDGSCEAYDVSNNTWHDVAAMPAHSSQQAGAVMRDRIYISGGLDPLVDDPLDQLSCYDPAADQWDKLQPMLSPRCDHAMVAHRQKLYVAGGWQMDSITLSRVILPTIDCFDVDTEQWHSITHMPTPRYHASMAMLGENLYLIGGFTEGQFNRTTKKIEIYSFDTENWVTHENYPFAIWEHLTCVMYVPTCLESRSIES